MLSCGRFICGRLILSCHPSVLIDPSRAGLPAQGAKNFVHVTLLYDTIIQTELSYKSIDSTVFALATRASRSFYSYVRCCGVVWGTGEASLCWFHLV